ncbi:MAG: class I SAM-dependent methyltransferase [Burkholderiales bacterium]|nr:class I SAM-dependent methyltransferase [Burkholderiales bacterium]
MDWSQYAFVYDLMATNNPAYAEIVSMAKRDFNCHGVSHDGVIADLGAGTGNLSLELAAAFRQCRVHHVDSSPEMILHARKKAAWRGLTNLEFIESDVEGYLEHAPALAAALSVHSLYAVPKPRRVMTLLFQRLESGALFVACDLGRTLDIGDWAGYLFQEMRRRTGTLSALAAMIRGRAVASHNKMIRARQVSGEYWIHTTEEFAAAVREAGFDVVKALPVYRGYSDYVVARKP